MRHFYQRSLRFKVSIVKGCLLVFIAMGDKASEILRSFSPDQWSELSGKEFFTAILSVLLTGAIATNLYLDKTVSDDQKKIANEDIHTPPVIVNPAL